MGLHIYNPQPLSFYYVTENNGVKINGTLVRVWYCEFGGTCARISSCYWGKSCLLLGVFVLLYKLI